MVFNLKLIFYDQNITNQIVKNHVTFSNFTLSYECFGVYIKGLDMSKLFK
jgi:hypothetical protein